MNSPFEPQDPRYREKVVESFNRQGIMKTANVALINLAPGKVELETILEVLNQNCARVRLMRLDDSGPSLESSFLVEFRDMGELSDAKAALRGLSDTIEITFMDNKGIG